MSGSPEHDWSPKITRLYRHERGLLKLGWPMTIPNCDPADTILQVELDKVSAQQAVLKIKLIYTEEGSYLVYVLKNNPTKELHLTTRRDRTRPKVFIDQNRLLADLHATYPGIIFEANGNLLRPTKDGTPPSPEPSRA